MTGTFGQDFSHVKKTCSNDLQKERKYGRGSAKGRAPPVLPEKKFYFCFIIIKLSSITPMRSTVWRFMAAYPRFTKKPFAVTDAKVVIL